jgi:hypothetical protein
VMMVVDRGANTLAGTHHYYCCFLMAISAWRWNAKNATYWQQYPLRSIEFTGSMPGNHYPYIGWYNINT